MVSCFFHFVVVTGAITYLLYVHLTLHHTSLQTNITERSCNTSRRFFKATTWWQHGLAAHFLCLVALTVLLSKNVSLEKVLGFKKCFLLENQNLKTIF